MASRRVVHETAARSRIRVESIRIVVDRDSDPEIAFLEQIWDADRRAEYERGKFELLYVRAEADVVIGELVQTLTSGGLYGIESDSEKSYFDDVASEEWRALRDVLKTIGVSTRQLPLEMSREWIEWRT